MCDICDLSKGGSVHCRNDTFENRIYEKYERNARDQKRPKNVIIYTENYCSVT